MVYDKYIIGSGFVAQTENIKVTSTGKQELRLKTSSGQDIGKLEFKFSNIEKNQKPIGKYVQKGWTPISDGDNGMLEEEKEEDEEAHVPAI